MELNLLEVRMLELAWQQAAHSDVTVTAAEAALAVILDAPLSVLEYEVARRKAEKEAGDA